MTFNLPLFVSKIFVWQRRGVYYAEQRTSIFIPRVAFQKIERKRKRKHHLRLRCQLRLRLVNVVTKGGPYEFLN